VQQSAPLSLFARPGTAGIGTRRVAVLVADGIDGQAAARIHQSLLAQGAVPRFVGIKLGSVESTGAEPVEVEVSMEAMPSVLWDALVVPDGERAIQALSQSGHAMEFLKDQYRHCKTILLLGAAADLLARAGIPADLPSGDADPGMLRYAHKPSTMQSAHLLRLSDNIGISYARPIPPGSDNSVYARERNHDTGTT
jgi:catalase